MSRLPRWPAEFGRQTPLITACCARSGCSFPHIRRNTCDWRPMRSVAAAPARSRARLRLALPARRGPLQMEALAAAAAQAAAAAPGARAVVRAQGAVGVLLAVPLAAGVRVEEPVEARPAVRAVITEPSQVRLRQVARVPLAQPVEVRPVPVGSADLGRAARWPAALSRQTRTLAPADRMAPVAPPRTPARRRMRQRQSAAFSQAPTQARAALRVQAGPRWELEAAPAPLAAPPRPRLTRKSAQAPPRVRQGVAVRSTAGHRQRHYRHGCCSAWQR